MNFLLRLSEPETRIGPVNVTIFLTKRLSR